MNNHLIIIKENRLSDAIEVSRKIPEFVLPYSRKIYSKKLDGKEQLVLTAHIQNEPVGFKIGYETPSKQNFYSWMGGVLPIYRQLGIAEKLLRYQENSCKNMGYIRILVKTRKKHMAMIKFLFKHNYIKIGEYPYQPTEETRILYEKIL